MKKSIPTDKISEANMKAMLLNHLKARGKISFGDTIINEFTLDNFARRADLSVIYDDKLIGFEIKSKNDSLSRLQGQVDKYLNHFDKVIIFSDQKHTKNISGIVPNNVEVWELNEKGITIKQRGNIKKITDKKVLLKMMTVSELSKLASNTELSISSRTRAKLENTLIELPSHIIRDATIRSLKSRFRVTSMLFWQNVSDEITVLDIKNLSPYSSSSKDTQDKRENSFKSVLDEIIEDSMA